MKTISVTELKAGHESIIAKFGEDTKLTLTRYGKPIASLILIGDSELQEIQAQELSTNVIK